MIKNALFFRYSSVFTGLVLLSQLFACATNERRQTADAGTYEQGGTVEDVIPITMANMRGHQALYDEGWFVVSSSKDSLAYAKQKSIISSREAILATAESMAQHNERLAGDLKEHWNLSFDLGRATYEAGSRITRNVLTGADNLGQAQIDFGEESFQTAWGTFIKGNLYIGRRTQQTREALMAQPGGYYKNLKQDFSNIYTLTASMQNDFATRIGDTWDDGFRDASKAISAEYEQSGQSSNSLVALGHIFQAYAKGLYYGLLKPGVSSAGTSVSAAARGATQAVFLPSATAISVTGRTIQAIGTTVFYTGKLGIEIVSPTVEAGFLSGLATLSLGTVPLTYVAGTGIGAINQIAFTAAAPVVTAGSGAFATGVDTSTYVAFVTFDAINGTSKVVFNQAKSAIVLGFNALTALPSHLFLATVDSAVFLAWDGPRLVVALARGQIGKGDSPALRVDSLPVGSVVDLEKLRASGVTIEVLSDDPAVINKVLEQIPNDMRE